MPGIPDSDDLSSPKGTCRRNNIEVGDFGLRVTVASGSKPFDNCCRGHAVTDAHRLQAILRLAPLQFVDQLGHQDGAGRADRKPVRFTRNGAMMGASLARPAAGVLPPAEGPRSTP